MKHLRLFAGLVLLGLAASLACAQDGDVTKKFTVKAGGTLRMDVQGESIEISTADGTTATVEVRDIDERDKDRLKIDQKDNDVVVRFDPSRRRRITTQFFITLPRTYNVTAEFGGGRFEITDKLDGTVDLRTGGGAITLSEVTGMVDVTSGGGEINASLLGSDAKIKTGGGNVHLQTIMGSTTISTGGGNVKVEKVGKDLTLSTGGGNVRIGAVGGTASLESGGGDLGIGSVMSGLHLRSGGGSLTADGAKGRTVAQSGGGSVELRGLVGSADVRTGGGNVKVELTPEGTEDSKVESRGGDVTFRIPESAKATIEVELNLRHRYSRKGSVRSDFKAEKFEKDEDGNVEARYVLNGGGPTIHVETTDGDIEVLKLSR